MAIKPAKPAAMRVSEDYAGAGSRTRTRDLPLTRRLLYQLSYAGRGAMIPRSACRRPALRSGSIGARWVRRQGEPLGAFLDGDLADYCPPHGRALFMDVVALAIDRYCYWHVGDFKFVDRLHSQIGKGNDPCLFDRFGY